MFKLVNLCRVPEFDLRRFLSLRIYDCICQLVITMGLWTVGQAFCDVRVVSIIVKGSFREAILSIIGRIIEWARRILKYM